MQNGGENLKNGGEKKLHHIEKLKYALSGANQDARVRAAGRDAHVQNDAKAGRRRFIRPETLAGALLVP